MRRPVPLALLLVAVVATVAGAPASAGAQGTVDCSFPLTATDATGTEVTVPAEPERVVVLGPSAAQTMWAIGAREKVVGMPINRYTVYLPDREGRTNVVGEDGQPVQETVVGLEPDLVLAPNIVGNDTVRSLRAANLTVYRFRDARSLADVYAKTELTGRLVGEFGAAANASAEMRGQVRAVREAVADEEPVRVYYALGGGWTAGDGTFITDVIETAGGRNVAVEAGIEGYGEISGEVVAERDPEWIVVHDGTTVPGGAAVANTTAGREGNVVRVDANFLTQAGPRNVIPLTAMAAAFHPEAYAGANLSNPPAPEPARCAVATETATRTPTPTPTEGASGPGFTVLVAVVAVLAFVASRCRRG